MPTEQAVQDHVFQAMYLYVAFCAKEGAAATSAGALLRLPLTGPVALSHWALRLGGILTSTI